MRIIDIHDRDLAKGTAMYKPDCPLSGSAVCPNDEDCPGCTFDVDAFLRDYENERNLAKWERQQDF